jgi:tetratricopeptide (TPR) repeat protein
MYLDYANLLRRAKADSLEIISALRKAVQLRPDFDDAHRFLGSMYLQIDSYGAAYSSLARVKNVKTREDARWLFHSMAFAQLELEGFENAIQYAKKALEFSDSPDEVSRVHDLIKHVEWRREAKSQLEASSDPAAPDPADRPQSPAVTEAIPSQPRKLREHVSGQIVEFECNGDSAVLHVLVDGAVREFNIADPNAVEVRGGSGVLDFTCGRQDGRPIRVGFESEQQSVVSIELQ